MYTGPAVKPTAMSKQHHPGFVKPGMQLTEAIRNVVCTCSKPGQTPTAKMRTGDGDGENCRQ